MFAEKEGTTRELLELNGDLLFVNLCDLDLHAHIAAFAQFILIRSSLGLSLFSGLLENELPLIGQYGNFCVSVLKGLLEDFKQEFRIVG